MGARRWILGIDFGTSFTTSAIALGDRVELLEIDHSRYLPSAVYMDFEGQLLVGRAGLGEAAQFPERAERLPKRALVRSSQVRLAGTTVSAVDLVAAVLRKVAVHAISYVGSAPGQLLLTHPAGWTQTQLDLLLDAAATAGLPAPELVPEPIGAAFWYAKETDLTEGEHVAVYDLGAGTFDTAVLRRTQTGFELAGRPGGNPNFGGEDLDEVLMEVVAGHAHGIDPEPWAALWAAEDKRGRRERAQLRRDVTEAKESLSERRVCHVDVPGYDHELRLTRGELEAAVRDGIRDTVDEFRRTLERAGIATGDLSGVFLAGGASRMPCVSDMLSRELGLMPATHLDPKTVVVLGAMAATLQRPAGAASSKPPQREIRRTTQTTQGGTELESPPSQHQRIVSAAQVEHPQLLVPDVIDLAFLDDAEYLLVRRTPGETEIVRIDPRTHEELARASASPTAWDLGASANGLAVSDGRSLDTYDTLLRKTGTWQPPAGQIVGALATSGYVWAFVATDPINISSRLSKGLMYKTSLARVSFSNGQTKDFPLGFMYDTYWIDPSYYCGLRFLDARAIGDAIGVISCAWYPEGLAVIKMKNVGIVENDATEVRRVSAGRTSWVRPAADLRQVIRRDGRMFLAFHPVPGAQALVRVCDAHSSDFGPSLALHTFEKGNVWWIVPSNQEPFVIQFSSGESVVWTLQRGELVQAATVSGDVTGSVRKLRDRLISFEPRWIDDGNRTWVGFSDPCQLVCLEAGQVVQTIPLDDVPGLTGPLKLPMPIGLVEDVLHCTLADGNGKRHLITVTKDRL